MDIIPASGLSHYFVSEDVISLTDHEEITKPTTSSHTAAELLLKKVLSMLKKKEDGFNYFHKMLSIMEHYGDSATCALSKEMKSRVRSSQQGMCAYMYTIS